MADLVELPSRLSQTLLGRFDVCPHSAYLGLKYKGRSHEMARGAAMHLFAEKATRLLIEQGEPQLPVEVAKQLANEALDETPGVTHFDADKVREMAYHWSVGFDVDIAQIAGIEQGLALDVGDWTVVGRLDLVAFADSQTALVDDYKSSFHMPDQAEVESDFQMRTYGVLLVFGRPVVIERDRLVDGGPPLGHGVQTVRLRQVYPRFLGDDNLMRSRGFWASRAQLDDWRVDLERLVGEVAAAVEATRALIDTPLSEEGFSAAMAEVWPAIHGTHCSRCPARGECPLDESVRSWAGEVNTAEQAAEAATWADRMKDRVAATERELKAWCSSHGPLEYGADLVREFVASDSAQTDWPALEDGIERAVNYGEPFSLSLYRKARTSMRFVKSKRSAA